jgi:hypothetical protein
MSNTVSEIIEILGGAQKRIKDSVNSVLYEEVASITKDLVDLSPVDKGDFKHGWRNLKVSNSDQNNIFSMRIENNTPYGEFLDQGVEENAGPWYFPGSGVKSGKLTSVNGKVWAGGLSPSGFVIGGMIDPVIYYNTKRVDRIARKLAIAVLGAL